VSSRSPISLSVCPSVFFSFSFQHPISDCTTIILFLNIIFIRVPQHRNHWSCSCPRMALYFEWDLALPSHYSTGTVCNAKLWASKTQASCWSALDCQSRWVHAPCVRSAGFASGNFWIVSSRGWSHCQTYALGECVSCWSVRARGRAWDSWMHRTQRKW
jgi:hypothetical protein